MNKRFITPLLLAFTLLSQPLSAEETVSLTQTDANYTYTLSFITSGETARLSKIDLLNYDANIVIPKTVEDEYGITYTVTTIGAKLDDRSSAPVMWDVAGSADYTCNLFRNADSYYVQYVEGLSLPTTITGIWPNAFRNAPLKKIEIPSGVKEIGAGCFTGSELTEITLPEQINEIYQSLFENCKNLSKITLQGKNISELWDSAFDGINSTAIIYINTATPPTIDQHTFATDCAATVYVPYGTAEAYTAKWANFSKLNFVEMNDGQTSAISTTTSKHFTVDSTNGIVSSDYPIEIFNASGVQVAVNGTNVKLQKGFYIVRCLGESTKVYIK